MKTPNNTENSNINPIAKNIIYSIILACLISALAKIIPSIPTNAIQNSMLGTIGGIADKITSKPEIILNMILISSATMVALTTALAASFIALCHPGKEK